MPIYCPAGIGRGGHGITPALNLGIEVPVTKVLQTYAYPQDLSLLYEYHQVIYPSISTIILDSGAFSTFKSGKNINLSDYIIYLKEQDRIWNSCGITIYGVCLDVIPGKNGIRSYDPIIVKEACEQGWKNYLYMKDRFDKDRIIHVYHQGDPDEYLHRILDEGIYLGLSSDKSVNSSSAFRYRWLSSSIDSILKMDIFPRIHGFGEADPTFFNLPFLTVDESGWALAGAYQRLITPMGSVQCSNRKIDNKRGNNFFLDEDDGVTKKLRPFSTSTSHFLSLPKVFQDGIRKGFLEVLGVSFDDYVLNATSKSSYFIALYNMIYKHRIASENMVSWEDYKSNRVNQQVFEIDV